MICIEIYCQVFTPLLIYIRHVFAFDYGLLKRIQVILTSHILMS